MKTTVEEMMLWYEMYRLQERYVSMIDADRLEEWPGLFTEDCVYEIVPRENSDLWLPIGIMHCFVARCCLTVSLHCARRMSSSRTRTGI